MAYQIDRYNRTLLTLVEDGTIDSSTDLRFIGKNYAGYGEIHNENFLFLLENFSGANPPPKALSGQLWFDNSQGKLKYYDGTIWRATGGSEVTGTAPLGLSTGDFWWDSGNDQLYVYNGIEFVLIGPEGVGAGLTKMVSQTVLDSTSSPRDVIVAFIDDSPISIFSATSFTINTSEDLSETGYDVINRGITLRDSTDGYTTSDYRFTGTATNADSLNRRPAADFITADNPDFVNRITTGISGMSIASAFNFEALTGGPNPLRGVIRNESGANNEIHFRTMDAVGNSVHSLTVNSTGLLPGATNTFNLGSPTLRFKEIYADSFSGGGASKADSLFLSGTTYLSASVIAVPNTIVARSANNVVFASEFNGIATSAKYADLAEKYTTDYEYSVGTIMAVGGTEETTVASSGSVPIGVVSEKPAFLMNSEADGQSLALKGRVPVRVVGSVQKGDPVYVLNNGIGSAEMALTNGIMVGIALEGKETAQEGLVECVLKV
jgi:hypothetical protein